MSLDWCFITEAAGQPCLQGNEFLSEAVQTDTE